MPHKSCIKAKITIYNVQPRNTKVRDKQCAQQNQLQSVQFAAVTNKHNKKDD